jgi:hypothetical protein
MMRTFVRKVLAGIFACFWGNKKRFLCSVFTGFWAVQHIACAYGVDDDVPEVDKSLICSPIFDVSKMSGQGYDTCEQTIADEIRMLADCNDKCADSTLLNKGVFYGSFFESEQLYCTTPEQPSHYEGCADIPVNGIFNTVSEQIANCPMTNFKAEGSLSGYKCANEEKVSVEEGERRSEEARRQMAR